jgi:anti-sigma regulatory factor (Ser/Thr protein kinase)
MDAKRIFLARFSDSERDAVSAIVSEFGYTTARMPQASDGGMLRVPRLVFVMVKDAEGLSTVRQFATDFPENFYAAIVDPVSRDIVFQISLVRELRLCFLPFEKKELRRLISAMTQQYDDLFSSANVFAGLKAFEFRFEWETAKIKISRVSRFIARELAQAGFYVSAAEEDECVLALEEALVNSIEHGNLELDSSLRPDELAADNPYDTEREKRLADSLFGKRKLYVDIRASDEEARIVIRDEGKGFDTSKLKDYLNPSGAEPSGKGLALISRPFDSLEYNKKGDELTLVRKRFGI